MFRLLSILALFVAISTTANAQTNMQIKTEDAHYLGDDSHFHYFLLNNIKYTPEAIKAKAAGILMVTVDVEADSTVSNVNFLNSFGYGIEEQIKALISPMKFAPKIMNGRPFKSDILYNIQLQAH